MSSPATARQLEFLNFMRDYLALNGRPPTMREMCTHFGVSSTNGVNDCMKALIKKGLVIKLEGVRCFMPVANLEPVAIRSVHVPWDACTISFGVDDPAAITRAETMGRLPLPPGWRYVGTLAPALGEPLATEAVYEDGRTRPWPHVAVFAVPLAPRVDDGLLVIGLLRAIGARP